MMEREMFSMKKALIFTWLNSFEGDCKGCIGERVKNLLAIIFASNELVKTIIKSRVSMISSFDYKGR